jgi:hypothetical protein
LVRDLHPEFGYLGSFHLFSRKLGLVLVFIGFGVLAGMSGLAVFMADEQPDPMKAMALAPPEVASQSSSAMTAPADASVRVEPVQRPAETKTGRPSCEGSAAMDCALPKPLKPRFVPAANERPAIAAVPIGRVDPVPLVPAQAAPMPPEAVPVAAVPEAADVSNQPAEAAPAAPAAPLPAVKKPRVRVDRSERVERRERDREPVGRSNYGSATWAGYARVY